MVKTHTKNDFPLFPITNFNHKVIWFKKIAYLSLLLSFFDWIPFFLIKENNILQLLLLSIINFLRWRLITPCIFNLYRTIRSGRIFHSYVLVSMVIFSPLPPVFLSFRTSWFRFTYSVFLHPLFKVYLGPWLKVVDNWYSRNNIIVMSNSVMIRKPILHHFCESFISQPRLSLCVKDNLSRTSVYNWSSEKTPHSCS